MAGKKYPDTERLRYEIEAKSKPPSKAGLIYWPHDGILWVSVWKRHAFYNNSLGKHIATFRLKAWK
jgi:hypothetical protein